MANALPVSPLARPLPELPPVAGVRFGATAAGIRYTGRTDLVMAEFVPGTTVAGVYTRSKCPGAPVDWCRAAMADGRARALVVNAGNANVFTGRAGFEATQANAADAARLVNCAASEVFLASTGVIGEILPYQKISAALPGLYATLSDNGWADAARGIMTTDTFPKAATRTARIGDTTVRIQGIVKGSGMVAPDMATLLSFIATDAKLPAGVIQSLLSDGVKHSFNCITVDSDTSTSDMILLFATGQAGNVEIGDAQSPHLADFRTALDSLLLELALLVIRDGEGVTKMMHIVVTGAVSDDSAHRVAMAVANSPLVKTAVSGEDANWGRVVMAVGKCGEPANRDTLSVGIGGTWIARNGTVVHDYDETPVVAHMRGQEIEITVDLGLGNGTAQAWGCDLTHGYININGSYRS
ncbi:bifunctional glutamate N-acetyltransferase/amino-acid acetyltransferase ArgJ [Komagataeibacter intermedius]|uniref:Arginine biosynthesis bifunctional protein ArgJ n=2 Tax=Komagataeibacter intermedius TaxID=66229 RepID=A0A0N1F918_9PROT|nr:bifunctional glutamate N-acetyltransferase/amino-acid acetyltransferase ArgJ [Komagataeibacter intermedius]KPH85141.1 N-acetylglutamate synthase [Komagataeibacter intermedius AF2]MCF3638175.1 bifunctional glutamate N-acetyltransferase/amino-acid acetyltransferase ArgJ [Komagataeibacter intermedius]GAN85701.1 bifunctional ornithine acetyltransferase/N-acetylglutamate synthase [Komagataeibacter intermedius TF2]GBQ78300.1 N-acetylglutamate synthase [Komagataeibacter intermedius NRIC 0521]